MKALGLIGLSVVLAASISLAEEAVKCEKLAACDKAAPCGKAAACVKPMKAKKMDFFKSTDTNGDGKLSLEEFKVTGKGDAEKKFADADADKDGFVTADELKAAKKAAHEAAKAAKAAKAEAAPAK